MPVALTTQESIAFIIVAAAFVLFAAALAFMSRRAYATRRRERKPDIPPAMQPAPSDTDLEKPRLERGQGWALAGFLFMAVWIPLVWLLEPSANLHQDRAIKTEAIARGARSVELFSETNIAGVGCVRCHGDGLRGGRNLFNGLIVDVPPLTHVCAGSNAPTVLPAPVTNLDDIRNYIMKGIPDTDMPSWSVRYAGGLDDQQIQDIVTYLVYLNQKNVKFKDNVCINTNAKAYKAPT